MIFRGRLEGSDAADFTLTPLQATRLDLQESTSVTATLAGEPGGRNTRQTADHK